MEKTIEYQLQGFLATPPLWKNKEIYQLKQFNLEKIPVRKKIFPAETTSICFSKNYIMGKRMESMFHLLIHHSHRYKVLKNNLQVISNKITVGELDFLLEDNFKDHKIHVEMVYKFYLYDPSLNGELDPWIGPNRKDTLVQKLQKLKEKQLPLLYNPATAKVLENLNLSPSYFRQEVCFKANLFVPKKLLGKTFPCVNNICIAGYWINLLDFTEEEYSKFYYFAPKKPDWPILPQNNEEWVSYQEIKQQILLLFEQKKSPLIWMRKKPDVFERLFIVWW